MSVPDLELNRSHVFQQAQEVVVEVASWTEMHFVDEAGKV